MLGCYKSLLPCCLRYKESSWRYKPSLSSSCPLHIARYMLTIVPRLGIQHNLEKSKMFLTYNNSQCHIDWNSPKLSRLKLPWSLLQRSPVQQKWHSTALASHRVLQSFVFLHFLVISVLSLWTMVSHDWRHKCTCYWCRGKRFLTMELYLLYISVT